MASPSNASSGDISPEEMAMRIRIDEEASKIPVAEGRESQASVVLPPVSEFKDMHEQEVDPASPDLGVAGRQELSVLAGAEEERLRREAEEAAKIRKKDSSS